MTKNVSNNPSSRSARLTLGKSERLCRETTIRSVFEQGKSIHYEGFTLFYFFTPLPEPVPAQIVFSAPKRQFREANERNRVKRLLREAYRHQKHLLYPHLLEKQSSVALMLMYKKPGMPSLPTCLLAVEKLLNQLLRKIQVKS